MSWIETKFEKEMKKYFCDELGVTSGEAFFIQYSSIRDNMYDDNFFGQIKGSEPDLSDHSERHIQDVFETAYKLISDEEFRSLSVYEIYCLALMILFHDVGNIYGRTGHDSVNKIADVYNKYRPNISRYREEKRLISLGSSAHSGDSKSGSKDTLIEVNDGSLNGNKIRLAELAAILRFADECAEGKQRTCSFLIEKNLLGQESEIFHKYAEITDIEIDKKLNRISITYHIDIPSDFNRKAQKEFKDLMRFTFNRVVKLDVERRYTKYYSAILKPFNYVTAQYNFSVNEIPIVLNLGKVKFEDQYPIPGVKFPEQQKYVDEIFYQKNSSYSFENIISQIKRSIEND